MMFVAVSVGWIILGVGWDWWVVIGELVIIVGLMEFVGSLEKFLNDEGFFIGQFICRELLGITSLLVGCLVVIGVRLVGLLTVIVGE